MQKYKMSNMIRSIRQGRKNHGFTMVEMIVVLAIIAILAAVGAFAAIGYINRSKFDQNSQNAITVYQTAQAALSKKMSEGTIDTWTRGIEAVKAESIFDQAAIEQLESAKTTDQSIHKKLALTYNPNSSGNAEDKYLYDLLSSYFYDKTIFGSTISLELDISATYGTGKVNYSAHVVSAFSCGQNTADSGWDSKCIGTGYSSEFPDLPQARGDEGYDYRRSKSFVGWFNGTSEAVTVPTGISPVFLPQSMIVPLDGHIVAGDETGYLFNLRNGETLDVSWAIFDEDGNAHEDHDENITITLKSAGDGINSSETKYGNDPSDTKYNDDVQIIISSSNLDKFLDSVTATQPSVKYERISVYDITRTSRSGFIKADVIIRNNTYSSKIFPLEITKVEGDGRQGTPRTSDGDIAPYYEFRLSIDVMMERSDENTNGGWDHFSIDRLTDIDNNGILNPRNIYATLLGSWNYVSSNGSVQTRTIEPTKPTIAARAIDDPVYYTDVTPINGRLTYCYLVLPEMGMYDGDDSEDAISGNAITGRCVVNTLFGDLVYKKDDNQSEESVAGTSWTSSGGRAVITSYRHFYNIRRIDSKKTASFKIVRNLDWYIHDTVKINGSVTELYSSEVKVYSRSQKSYSPVTDGKLKIVSFPAIQQLYPKHQLSSVSSATEKKIFSINNVQMRVASFRSGKDAAYGLICVNNGTIYNIYTNNLNLILADVKNGAPSDYSGGSGNNVSICPDGEVTFGLSGQKRLENNNQIPVGGLIGQNRGKIGLDEAADSVNIISMKNTIVMAGEYWNAVYYKFTGGVVGVSTSTLDGIIEFKGSFAVIGGGDNVAGITGESKADIYARFVVDGTSTGDSEFTLPVSSETDTQMSCVIAGPALVAGGTAWLEKHALKYGTAFDVDSVSHNQNTGKMSFTERTEDFQIDVTVPEEGLIIRFGNNDNSYAPAGAISYWKNGNGDFANIRVRNYGYIVVSDTNTRNVSVGSAVSSEVDNTVPNVYMEIVNGEGSRVGSMSNDKGPLCAGGAYGWISAGSSINKNRTITINAVNSGSIVSRGSANGQGSGGVIGGVAKEVGVKFILNVINDGDSRIIGNGSHENNGCGAGGAIGGMGTDRSDGTTTIPDGSVIYVENKGIISGKYHVGGAVGNAAKLNGDIYTVNSGTIEGIGFVGGVIGRITYPDYGYIQSILDGANIKGKDFIGGAVGRIGSFQDNVSVKAIVKSDSSIEGTGSIIGGVCGDICISGPNGGSASSVDLAGNSSLPKLRVISTGEAAECLGGAVGIMRANKANYATVNMPDQSANNKIIIHADGNNAVGGAIGKLRSSDNGNNNPSQVSNNNAKANNIFVRVSMVLHPQSHISGTGIDVGGAIGFIDSSDAAFEGRIVISTTTGSSEGGSYIQGVSNVGGAVGRFGKTKPVQNSDPESCIYVDFSDLPWKVTGTANEDTDANTGGAVGFFDNYWSNKSQYSTVGYENSTFPIEVDLGTSTVSSEGNNVGGAIGKNLIRAGNISVTSSGEISGHKNVGGAIGQNITDINSVKVSILGSGTVLGGIDSEKGSPAASSATDFTGTNAGGAIGYHYGKVNTGIQANISGKVIGYGNNVGGAVGLCYSGVNSYWINDISAALQGDAMVKGYSNYVGGAIGCTLGDIRSVSCEIKGTADVEGVRSVGGAIGFATTAEERVISVTRSNGPGRIDNVEAIISADKALVGFTNVGGAIGEIGYKKDKYTAPVLGKVRCEINAATLFDPEVTGTSEANGDACIGGILGHFVDGYVDELVLGGTGGIVHVDYPDRTYTNTVLIKASGRSIGGMVGQIGVEGYQQNECLAKISVEPNGPSLCVVSVNGSDRIGGWIGSGFAAHGGIGNNTYNEFNTSPAVYNVDNVRVVYTGGSFVGGFMGYADCYNNNKNTAERNIYAKINVNLNETSVIGKTGVGGIIGYLSYARFDYGSLSATISNYSNIGDIGKPKPGDNNSYTPMCYDAGGAIGNAVSIQSFTVPVNVDIDSTSMVCGLASQEDASVLSFEKAGVGGAFGRVSGKISGNSRVHVNSDISVVSVYSLNSNVGGCAGVIEGEFTNSGADTFDEANPVNHHWSNVTVEGDGEEISVGGFAGLVVSGAGINKSHSTGKVIATGQNSYVGGFVGSLRSGKISNSYSTSVVSSNGYCTGGFIGSSGDSQAANVENCYVGGHTYEGQYTEHEGNISGAGNVGGFIGIISGKVQIQNCYSTASVLGTGENIGGFVGKYAVADGYINNCYTTSRVTGPMVETVVEDGITEMKHSDTTGAFAGFTQDLRYTNDRVMSKINGGSIDLVGKAGNNTVPAADQIAFAEQSGIHSGSPVAYPYDASLLSDEQSTSTAFPLRAVLGNEHHGDWPNPVTGNIDISNATIDLSQEKFVYDPNGIDVSQYLKLTIEDTELILGQDYTLSYKDNDKAGKAYVIIVAKTGSEYKGTVSKSFEILKANITDAKVKISPAEYEYTGAPIVPTTVSVVLAERELKQNQDYFLSYEREDDRVKESELSVLDHTNITKNGVIWVSITGMGNYEGFKAKVGSFTIKGSSLDSAEITLINASAPELVYTGNEIVPGVVVRLGGKTLKANEDYEVSYNNNIDAGVNSAEVIVTGKGSYSGTRTVKFSISPATNSWTSDASIEGWIFSEDGRTAQEPGGETKFGDVVFEYYKDNDCKIPAVDNDPSIVPNDAGSYYIKAYTNESELNNNGTRNYDPVVAKIVPFTIEPADLSNPDIPTVITVDPMDYKYTGEAVTPEEQNIVVTRDECNLENDTDYTIIYPSDKTGPGQITFTVSGIGNYTGSITGNYQIVKYYTITFDTTGGSQVESLEVKEGEFASEPEQIPEKEGYEFECWCTDPAGELPFVFNENAVTRDITLYAKWIKTYEVSFESNADSIEISAQTVKSGETAARPDDPVWEEHTFEGWYSDEECTNPYDFALPVTDDITLYAKWSLTESPADTDPASGQTEPSSTPSDP